MKKGLVIATVVVFATISGFICARWLFPVCEARASNPCANHLKALHILCDMYAADHAGLYPSTWQALYDYYVLRETNNIDKSIFVCGWSGQHPGLTNEVDDWCSFLIVPNLTTNEPASRIIACCRPQHHKGKGANISFACGTIHWYSTDSFYKMLNEQGIKMPPTTGGTVRR